MNNIERALEYINDPIGKSFEEYEVFEKASKEALEKQVPMKTEVYASNNDVKIGRLTFKGGCTIHKCPVCKTIITSDKYCRECGQRIERCEP